MSKKINAGRTVTVKAHTRQIGGKKSAPKTAARSGKVFAQVSELPKLTDSFGAQTVLAETAQPVAAEKPHAERSVTVAALLTLLALAVVTGSYVVLLGVLLPAYGILGAAFRSLVPLAVEMIFGHAAHVTKKTAVAIGASLVVLGCAWTEIDAAQAAPAAIKAAKVAEIQNEAPFQCTKFEEPKRGGPQYAQKMKDAHDADCERDTKAAAERKTERLASAQASTPGEGRLAIELALFGAIGSSCFMPLLEGLLRAIRRK